MNTKKLKQLVLDLAIHGKLVPQDPNDEPASELLKRIQADVETRGRASNKSKEKKSAVSSVDLDEVPFEVPEGWEWCRLVTICGKLVDGDHNPPSGEKSPTPYLMASSKNIYNDRLVDLDDVRFLTEDRFVECDKRTRVSIGDLAITSVGTLGRTCIIKENLNITFQRSVTVVSALGVYNYYLKYCIDSPYIQKIMVENSRGTAQQGFYINQMADLLIPIPPLAEQHRIVAAIEKWFAVIDQLEKNEADLKKSIEQTKKKVLDLAIRGKLVAQNPEDEPASELLARIRADVETRGRASNKTKGKKSSIPSVDLDEVPFEVPEGWEWTRFGDYLDVRDGTHDSPKYVDEKEGIPFVTSKNLKGGSIDFSSVQYISIEDHKAFSQRSLVENNDILFAMIGSIGNPVLVRKDREFSIKNVALFKSNHIDYQSMVYVFFFLQYIQYDLREKAKGGMQPFIPLGYFRSELYIPLPPLAEQKRIVEKIEEVFGVLERIEGMME